MEREDLEKLDPSDYNVLLIVLDSCRYDTTEKASIPFLRSVGRIRKALTHADYTLPAHMAIFEGRLPTVEEPPYLPLYTDGIRQLWRVSPKNFFETKPKSKIALPLIGDNIVEGYANFGYFTIGIASLNYFARGRTLNSFFKVFLDYYDKSEGLIDPRSLKGFPLEHIDEIVSKLKEHEKWFLFVNTKETHYPYDIGEGYPKESIPLMEKMKSHLNLRHDKEKLTENESQTLHNMQISALEVADKRIKKLVDALPKNKPILLVVCADHGESFGEEFCGFQRCGHIHPSPEVMEVPLLIGVIDKQSIPSQF